MPYPLCAPFKNTFGKIVKITDAVPLIFAGAIVFVNFVVQKIFIYLTKHLRLASLSSRENVIMFSVLGLNLFNYGLLYLIATWSFKERNEQAINFEQAVTQFYWGQYTDFSTLWFRDIGTQVTITMLANLFVPILEFLINWSFVVITRMLD